MVRGLGRMHVVMIAAPADGAGRTTLAGWLARHAEDAGDGLVVALDANDDQALLSWARSEGFARPITAAWDHSCTFESLSRLEDEGVELVVVDCPLAQRGVASAALLAAADLALIVVRPQGEDLAATERLVDLVDEAGTPFVFVVNQACDDEETTAAIIFLAQHGTVSPVILQRREALTMPKRGSGEDGGEDQSDFAQEIARLWDYLGDCFARMSERAEPERETPIPPQDAKHAYYQRATFVVPEMVYPCHVMEISANGLSFFSEVELPRGSRVRFHLPYLGQFDCEVMDSSLDEVDARFVIDEARRVELLDRVAALFGPGHEQQGAAASCEPRPEEANCAATGERHAGRARKIESL